MAQRFGWFFAAAAAALLTGCADGSGLDSLWPNQPAPQTQQRSNMPPAATPAMGNTTYAPPLPVATGGEQRSVKVALLLPLSGDAAGIGKDMMKGNHQHQHEYD